MTGATAQTLGDIEASFGAADTCSRGREGLDQNLHEWQECWWRRRYLERVQLEEEKEEEEEGVAAPASSSFGYSELWCLPPAEVGQKEMPLCPPG